MIESDAPATTGRFIVTFADDVERPAEVLNSVAGLGQVASSRDFDGGRVDIAAVEREGTFVFDELGIAVVSGDPTQVAALTPGTGDESGPVLAISQELIHHVMGPAVRAVGESTALLQDTADFTWGVQVTQAATSPRSGAGIKVAVLDTGMDLSHPDFAGRAITAQSFVTGQPADDGHGHGTHCIGTSCGPQDPSTGPRYGIAYEAEIYVGKVLSNQGSGSDTGILAGMNWAVANDCHVVSMSLGADVPQVHPPYRIAGRRALNRGTLVIAAAGNNASRPGNPGFVGTPANSPNIIAVAALDQQLAVTYFSARSNPVRGGQVDVAGPGYQVYSSWPMPMRYNTISGTSMATPHAAGIAALWAEATGYKGRGLWAVMAKESQRLMPPSLDIGGGLVIAPQ
jgi:subtilisin family serine protease